jgi:hypothetical protein
MQLLVTLIRSRPHSSTCLTRRMRVGSDAALIALVQASIASPRRHIRHLVFVIVLRKKLQTSIQL